MIMQFMRIKENSKMKYLKLYNESVKDFLKPKSEDDINKSMNKLSPEDRFLKACEFGYTDLVIDLINNQGVDPTYEYSKGLDKAVINNHIDIVKILLDDDRYIAKKISGRYLVRICLNKKFKELGKLLLSYDKINHKYNQLHLKELLNVFDYITESVKDFLKPKSENDVKKSLDGLSPEEKLSKISKYKLRHYYTDEEYDEIVKSMLESFKYLSNEKKFMKGFDYDIPWLVKDMINKGVKADVINLVECIMYGKINVAKMLLMDNLVDPSDEYDINQPLIQAVSLNHIEIVELLLNDKRVDPTGHSNHIIKEASKLGHLEVLKLLLNDKRIINKLSKEEKEYYENRIKRLNESVKDFLKPKSKDDIISSLLSTNDPEKALEYLYKNFDVKEYKSVVKNLMSRMSNNWKKAFINSKSFKVKINNYDRYLYGCGLCNKLTPLKSVKDRKMAYGGGIYSLYKCQECEQYVMMDDQDKDIYYRKINKIDESIKTKKGLLNESVKDFLKPKSEEQIIKSLNNIKTDLKLKYIRKYNLFKYVTNEEIRDLLLNGVSSIEDLISYLTYDEFFDVLTEDDIEQIRMDFMDIAEDLPIEERLPFIEEYDQLGFYSQKDINSLKQMIEERNKDINEIY